MKRQLPLLLACAVTSAATAQSTLPPRVVAPEKLAGYWAMGQSMEADAPLYGKNLDQPGCATVSFVVEKDGRTSTIKVQKVVPEGDLARVAASAAASLRFEPTVTNQGRDRVFSWLIFPFNLPADPAERTAIMQRCAVDKVDWKDH